MNNWCLRRMEGYAVTVKRELYHYAIKLSC